MAFQTWQVGLDIQNGQLCAIGIQRRRNGWQLRHWWQHTLPHDTLTHGLVQRPDIVIQILRRWRPLLPSRIALRVGFPPQLVMQRQLALPAGQQHDVESRDYIEAAARRFFPVGPEALALDYRRVSGRPATLMVTAARREVLQSWLDCFTPLGLTPQVMDLAVSGLCALANAMAQAPDATLVHRLYDHWLWYSPAHSEQPWGWCPLSDAADFSLLRERSLSSAGQVWYSSALDEPLPAGTLALSPFTTLRFLQPPLPLCAGAFALAVGLALRPEDC